MTDYYVDSDVGGPGTGAFGDPWDDIASNTGSLSAGDTMYLRGSASAPAQIYTEAEINPFPVTGSSGSPIIIRPYQSELVRIRSSHATHIFRFDDIDYWELHDLIIDAGTSTTYDQGYCIDVDGGATHITIQDCELLRAEVAGVRINDGEDVLIDDCDIHDFYKYTGNGRVDAFGIQISASVDAVITNNEFYDTRGDCIYFSDATGPISGTLIEDNHIYCNDALQYDTENGIDCKLGDPTIRGNTFHGFRGLSTAQGEAILIHYSAAGALIEDNVIYNCTTGIRIGRPGIVVQRNLIYDCVVDGGTSINAGLRIDSCNDAIIYNNTFVNCPVDLFYLESDATNVKLRNNLAYNTGTITIEVGGTTDHDYNGWFDCDETRSGTHDTTGNGDPGFVNAAGDDYRLVSTSIVIDAGVDVGLDYYGDAPDLGYWEYEPLIPPIAVLREPGASLYKLRLKTAAGALIAEIIAFDELCYAKRINSPGLCTFKLDGDHTAIDQLEHKSQVEVWRENPDLQLDPHCDFYGLYLSPDRFQSERNVFTTVCPGQMWFLSTRIIAWYAATADRTAFTSEPAETIMKTLVDYNACAAATIGNGRERNGAITGLSIQADSARGNSLDWNCAWKNLLLELRDLAQVAGGDFDLIKTAAQAWEFRWYTGQRGNDRRGSIVFARERGNMINPRYLHDRMNEKTVAIVGGQGEKDQRDIVIRTGDDYSASNDVEVFVDARNRSITAGYNAAGDKRLSELRAREAFSFEVVQTPSCFYGKVASGGDYELGDLVTARAFDIEKEHKVIGVTVTAIPAAEYYEAIDIDVETPVTAP